MDKKDIIDLLERIGTMMEIKGENPFKIRAYFAGARTLQTMEDDLGEVIAEGRLGRYSWDRESSYRKDRNFTHYW